MFCRNCGTQLDDSAKFCPHCGAACGVGANPKTDFTDAFTNTADYTAEFSPEDIQNNKGMAILAYIGILVLIPIFAEKNSKYVRFHSNQGLILFIIEAALSLITSFFSFIPIVGIFVSVVTGLAGLACLVYIILGIVNAASGYAKELPFIGKIRIMN